MHVFMHTHVKHVFQVVTKKEHSLALLVMAFPSIEMCGYKLQCLCVHNENLKLICLYLISSRVLGGS